MRHTEPQKARMSSLLFIPASARRDNCAGCRHSRTVDYDHSLYCHLSRAAVSGGSVCAGWKPIRRWVPCAA